MTTVELTIFRVLKESPSTCRELHNSKSDPSPINPKSSPLKLSHAVMPMQNGGLTHYLSLLTINSAKSPSTQLVPCPNTMANPSSSSQPARSKRTISLHPPGQNYYLFKVSFGSAMDSWLILLMYVWNKTMLDTIWVGIRMFPLIELAMAFYRAMISM